MRNVNTINGTNVLLSLAMAGLCLVSGGAQAQAATHTVTVTGVIGSVINGGPIAYDTSSWLNKAYTLEMTFDASNTVRQHTEIEDIPGEFINSWAPIQLDYRLAIAGVPVLSRVDNQYSRIESLNDVTVPAGLLDVPPGVVAGRTYDDILIDGSNLYLGCFDGGVNNVCGDVGDISEGLGFGFELYWDVAEFDAITDDNLPDLGDLATKFAQGYGYMEINFWHSTLGTNGQYTGDSVAWLPASVTNVAVTAVPEPETYAMMLAGLSLVGFAARRRAAL